MAGRLAGTPEAGTIERTEHPGHPGTGADLLAWRTPRDRHRPRGGLGRRTPLEEARRWRGERPEPFGRGTAPSAEEGVPNLTGPDT